jgi:eukaryotic-like serine/threonine-protein kinase
MRRRSAPIGPAKIGEYEVIERFAPGGLAELFKVRHAAGGPVVCLKRIPPSVADDVDFVLRFEDEVTLASSLRHPNVVEVIDRGEDEGHFLVMELVDGADLAALLDRHETLEPPLVAYLGCEVARALSYIHRSDPATGRKALIHFDVSPPNILIGKNGAVKLSDFGLARALRGTGAETITSTRGRRRYLSPEQWNNDSVGSRSDLFSLGLALWSALVGTHPFAEARPSHRGLDEWIREQTITNARRRAVDAAPHAPPALYEALDALLQPAGDRIATAEVLFHMLAPCAPIDGAARLAAKVSR